MLSYEVFTSIKLKCSNVNDVKSVILTTFNFVVISNKKTFLLLRNFNLPVKQLVSFVRGIKYFVENKQKINFPMI